jgi:NitT/TauT family transport system permease protein/taurine transport system permease protein/sulfonate transport system permease protein
MLNVGRSTGRTEVTLMTIVILGGLMIVAEELIFAPLERRTCHWRPAVAR